MFIRRFKRQSIQHPLACNGQLPSDVLKDYVERLRTGDKDVIAPIVLSHIRLIVSIVGQYLTSVSGLDPDDLVSISLVAALEVCNNLPTDGDITRCIMSRTYSVIGNFVKRHIRYNQRHHGIGNVEHAYNQSQMFELNEALAKAIETDDEKLIIDLRRKSYNDREISEILGISESIVAKLRNEVKRRFIDQ